MLPWAARPCRSFQAIRAGKDVTFPRGDSGQDSSVPAASNLHPKAPQGTPVSSVFTLPGMGCSTALSPRSEEDSHIPWGTGSRGPAARSPVAQAVTSHSCSLPSRKSHMFYSPSPAPPFTPGSWNCWWVRAEGFPTEQTSGVDLMLQILGSLLGLVLGQTT